MLGCTISSNNSSYKTLGDTTWDNGSVEVVKDANASNSTNCAAPNYAYKIDYGSITFSTGGLTRFWADKFNGIDYLVDWGDGTISTGSTTVFGTGNTSQSDVPWAYHIYTSSGQYSINIKFKPKGYSYYPIDRQFTLTVPPNSCANPYNSQNKCKVQSLPAPDSRYRVKGQIKIFKQLLANSYKAQAKTWAYRKLNNKWRNRRTNYIKAKFDVDVLFSSDCSYLYHLPGFWAKNNRSVGSTSKVFSLGGLPSSLSYGDLGFEEIISVHEVDGGSSAKSAKLTLTLRACNY